MHYLGLALYAEGPTDERFLGPLLLRLCDDICTRRARSPVEINEVLPLGESARLQSTSREERILAAARQAQGAWSLVFIHGDADGDAQQARNTRVQPAVNRLHEAFGDETRAVAVIPVRTTEAWAVCDGDALREVLGTQLGDAALGLPSSAASSERHADPKQCLTRAFEASQAPGRRRQGARVGSLYGPLGERVRLARLRELSAFIAFESELTSALADLRVID